MVKRIEIPDDAIALIVKPPGEDGRTSKKVIIGSEAGSNQQLWAAYYLFAGLKEEWRGEFYAAIRGTALKSLMSTLLEHHEETCPGGEDCNFAEELPTAVATLMAKVESSDGMALLADGVVRMFMDESCDPEETVEYMISAGQALQELETILAEKDLEGAVVH